MRSLALLGVLATAACGLDMGGLGADPTDAGATPGAMFVGQGMTTSQDANTGADTIVTLSIGDTGSVGAESGASANRGADSVAPPPDDGGGDAGPLAAPVDSQDAGDRDAGVGDTSTPFSPIDAGGNTAPDAPLASMAPLPGDGSAACARGIPSGWTLSVYSPGRDPCPSNFTAHEVNAEPTVGPTACSCACSVSQQGDCLQGTMTVFGSENGNGNSCSTELFTMDISGTGCLTAPQNSGPVSLPMHMQATPLPPQGGTCSGTSQLDTTQVSTPAARYCDVPGASADAVCNGAVPSGFAVCIATSGVTTCPLGTPFVQRHVVEDGVMLQCSPCTACAVATTCTSPTITAYDNRACHNSPVASVQLDGACDSVSGQGRGQFPIDAQGVEYTATATSTCTPGSSSAAAQLANPRTICCQ
jgi:hypothetical protein